MGIELNDEIRRLLDGRHFAVLATINPDGGPQTSAMWIGRDGDDVLFSTVAGRRKHRNLERDPRATVGIEDGVEYQELRGAMLECAGEVERDTERVAEYGAALVDRYAGGSPEMKEFFRKQAPKRVGLRFTPTRIVSWDHRKMAGTY